MDLPVLQPSAQLKNGEQMQEDETRLTEERFRAIMEQAPFSIQVLAPNGHTLRVNRAWEELWGITLEQIADYNMLNDPQLEAKGIMPYIRRAFSGEAVEIPAIQYDPNETIPDRTRHKEPQRWVAAVAYPVRSHDGQLQEVVLMHQDITARKNAEIALAKREAELQESEARFRTLIAGAPVAVSVSRFGSNLYVNAAYRRCFGIADDEEVVGRSILEQISPEEHERIREHVRRRYAGEFAPQSYELTGLRGDGSRFPVQIEVGQIELSDGSASVAFITDITERKRAEEALRDADRRKNEFLATLAHELRNPLAPIRNAVQILNLQGTHDPAMQTTRDMINRQVHHLARLIDDLLDVSRITLGKLELRKERVQLLTVVEQALETSQPHVETGRHELSVALPREPIYLEVDPVRIAQVLSNLLNNACKYTEEGGFIELVAVRQSAEVVIRIKDSGIGISADHLPRLFEMFSQEEAALKRSQGGLGIGLALARGLLEMHNGSIEARSNGPAQGSEFIVRLPVLVGTAPASAQVESTHAGKPAAGSRILVVDDNRDSADSLAKILRLQGSYTRTAYDGAEACSIAESFRPDVVLLDIGLPKLNGLEVAQRLRAQPWGKETILIAQTGWGQDEDLQRSRQAGFDHHLVKPLDLKALMKLLAAHNQ